MVNGNSLWLPPGVAVAEKANELAALSQSVTGDAHPASPQAAGGNFIMWGMAAAGSYFPAWGTSPKARDALLRAFWPTETFLAGAIGTLTARDAAMEWKITGDEKAAEAGAAMLRNANNGAGWESMIAQIAIDIRTQDSGAYVEFVRENPTRPDSPVIGLNALDSARVYQTGVPEVPAVYEDANSVLHYLPWHSVVQLLEMPSPQTFASLGVFYRLQVSALSRVLQYARVMKAVGEYDEERITGRFVRAVHLLSGITTQEIADATAKAHAAADAQGLARYMQPVMVGSINPEAKVGHDTIPLASLPEGWDVEKHNKWYGIALSMALLCDLQEFMPMPGGNLGSGQQSEVLHAKGRGQGQGLFRALIARMINLHGALPASVTFEWDESDIEADKQVADTAQVRAETRKSRIESGEITPEVARQIALDDNDLTQEIFDALKAQEEELREERETAQAAALAQVAQAPAAPSQRARTPAGESAIEGEDGEKAMSVVGPLTSEKASGSVAFGTLLSSRLHRAYAMTADDASALGYFPELDDRLAVAESIGPALAVFEELLREAGVWEIPVRAEDADRLMEASFKALDSERAGPEDARLEMESEFAEEIGAALGKVRRELRRRMLALTEVINAPVS